MSSSPSICASPNFRFPNSTGNSGDYFGFNKEDHKAVMKEATEFLSHNKPKLSPVIHKATNNSVSSLTSNTSDMTLYEHPPFLSKNNTRTDSVISTETLVDDYGVNSNKNTLNLRLNLPKHRVNKSFNFSREFCNSTLREEDETPKASSAIESTFNFKSGNTQDAASSPHTSMLDRVKPFDLPAPPLMPPLLRKQNTLPTLATNVELSFETIKQEQSRRLYPVPVTNYKESIKNISPNVNYVTCDEAIRLMNNSYLHDNLPNFLIIDIRSFTDFVKGHIKDSLNVCLPSTLLKRSNYSLSKFVNSLPQYEQIIFKNYIMNNEKNKSSGRECDKGFVGGRYGLPAVLLYDHSDNSANLYHFCKKFTSGGEWDDSAPIYILESGFSNFIQNYPICVEAGNSQSINTDLLNRDFIGGLVPPQINDRIKLRANSMSEIPTNRKHDFEVPSTSILSNFTLPETPKRVFKIRHTEEILRNDDRSIDSSIQLLNRPDNSELPHWIKMTLNTPNKLNSDFALLEESEKNRLMNALSLSNANVAETCPVISSGIEYGHKNRYKDIFLYEHSRVKLNDLSKKQMCDYINASYLKPSKDLDLLTNSKEIMPHLKYIATQGPLMETIGDFWKCVINNNTPIVVSLTDEFENGVTKCSPFWNSGVYKSNENVVNVKLVQSQNIMENLILRYFDISMDNYYHRKVLQIHSLSWPDMGCIVKADDLIKLIVLKKYIISQLPVNIKSEYPTLIHCSAGCGRTGTLCTVDTILNILMANKSSNLAFDPIYSIVDNFRRQRISMVQNLRQYYSIYDCVLEYLNNYKTKMWDDLLNLDIINDFMRDLD